MWCFGRSPLTRENLIPERRNIIQGLFHSPSLFRVDSRCTLRGKAARNVTA